jgi:hypothetical protein
MGEAESHALQGWQQIADYLGQPVSVVQRWAKSGMPVSHENRRVYASPNDLNLWLARESAGGPIQIATENADLVNELKRGLLFVRKQGTRKPKKKAAIAIRPEWTDHAGGKVGRDSAASS